MTVQTFTIYDPAMCCSTGVCGADVDPKLAQFSADLDWLSSQGVLVRRYNLAQEPGAFVADMDAKAALERAGESALPLIKADNTVVSAGAYPSRAELSAWAGIQPTGSLYTAAVAELVAIGASIAANCEPCFKFHYDKARKLGVTQEDMLSAVTTAQAVKDSPARAMSDLANRYLKTETETEAKPAAAKESCCGSSEKKIPAPNQDAPATKSCCGPSVEQPETQKKSGCC